ncbi:copper chaperone PCu(A)C [Nocardiopsis exhalans]|uniref:Copper chaperone PCu(A)C n=2 Tax=Nocardiopsis exhalans TaxID=163604 RepID=A0ABY5DI51_9ACTN|nr:copper chaperone PCu(A)C [Nocardiopsis exhalans]USY22917.1 copper chaperone PCu(A)C [Nocardiopsis exhalans]
MTMRSRTRTLFTPRLPLVSALALTLLATSCASEPEVPEPVAAAVERGSTQSGALLIEDAWMPEPANPEVGVVYLAVTNTAATADAVTGVHTSASPDADLCNTETTESGAGAMRVVDEIPVPAGGTTTFVDGGYHVMVNDIPEPLAVGDAVTVTLTFASGSEAEVEVPVQEMTGPAPDHSGHDDPHGHH